MAAAEGQSLPEFFYEYFTGLGFTKTGEGELSLKHINNTRDLVVCLFPLGDKYCIHSVLWHLDSTGRKVRETIALSGAIVVSPEDIKFLQERICYHQIAIGNDSISHVQNPKY